MPGQLSVNKSEIRIWNFDPARKVSQKSDPKDFGIPSSNLTLPLTHVHRWDKQEHTNLKRKIEEIKVEVKA